MNKNDDMNDPLLDRFRREINQVVDELKKAYDTINKLQKENEELKRRLASKNVK